MFQKFREVRSLLLVRILKAKSEMDGDQEDVYTERVGEEARTDFDEESSIISL